MCFTSKLHGIRACLVFWKTVGCWVRERRVWQWGRELSSPLQTRLRSTPPTQEGAHCAGESRRENRPLDEQSVRLTRRRKFLAPSSLAGAWGAWGHSGGRTEVGLTPFSSPETLLCVSILGWTYNYTRLGSLVTEPNFVIFLCQFCWISEFGIFLCFVEILGYFLISLRGLN